MFDLTKEIKIDHDWQKKYKILRVIVYLTFLLGLTVISFKILFPIKSFDFFFRTAGALKNTVVSPRNQEDAPLSDGKLPKDNNLTFDTSLSGDFSRINVTFVLEKDSESIDKGSVSARKSFQSLFYPEGDPMGFKDGSLVKNSKNYYIISNSKLREFSSLQLVKDLGYDEDSFKEVFSDELKYNKEGDIITSSDIYPDDSLFKVGDDYYQIKNQKLSKFVSRRAFSTQYEPKQAIEKGPEFLENFEISEDFIGFADGTLLSLGLSGFTVSQGKILPINNVTTFESMGFNWDDVISANGEEIGIYEKTKLFTIDQPHPDGVILSDKEMGKLYYVQNGERREFTGPNIINSYLKKDPVLVEEKGLRITNQCELKKKIGFSKKYDCVMPIESMKDIIGNDYQFVLNSDSDIKIKEINIMFKRNATLENLRLALSDIKKKIIINYIGE